MLAKLKWPAVALFLIGFALCVSGRGDATPLAKAGLALLGVAVLPLVVAGVVNIIRHPDQ